MATPGGVFQQLSRRTTRSSEFSGGVSIITPFAKSDLGQPPPSARCCHEQHRLPARQWWAAWFPTAPRQGGPPTSAAGQTAQATFGGQGVVTGRRCWACSLSGFTNLVADAA